MFAVAVDDSERVRSITVAGVVRGVEQAERTATAAVSSSNTRRDGVCWNIWFMCDKEVVFILPLIVKAQKRPRLGPYADSGGN